MMSMRRNALKKRIGDGRREQSIGIQLRAEEIRTEIDALPADDKEAVERIARLVTTGKDADAEPCAQCGGPAVALQGGPDSVEVHCLNRDCGHVKKEQW